MKGNMSGEQHPNGKGGPVVDEAFMLAQERDLYPDRYMKLIKPLPELDISVLAYNLALLGLDDQQLADVLADGNLDALKQWIHVLPNIGEMIKKGRLYADAEVAAALFRRAKGYDLDDIRERYVLLDDGTAKRVGYEKRHQHVPASVDAIELWLKTRQPTAWPLKPTAPVDALPGEPKVEEDDIEHIIGRLRSLKDRLDQGAEPSRVDPEGSVD